MIALMVCSRFSAWSKTIEAGGLEDLVGDLERRRGPTSRRCVSPTSVSRLWSAGRQCRNFTSGFPVAVSSSALTW